MPIRLFARPKPTHDFKVKMMGNESDNLIQLDQRTRALGQYHDNLATELREHFKVVSASYENESLALLQQRSKGIKTLKEQVYFDDINTKFTRWQQSPLYVLVYDYGDEQKFYDNCNAFDLGEKSKKYEKIKIYLQNPANWEQKTDSTKMAVEKLREAVQKFELSRQNALYFHAYSGLTNDTYVPPDENRVVMQLR